MWGVQFQCRLFPVGPGIDIGRSCRFLGSLIRFLALLPGGFVSVFALSHWCKSLPASTFGTGKSVGMGLLLGPGKRRIPSF